ncbi:IRGC [Symbiodinium natans]|uniref:IRGC protein n=1 Tax=Symbiodinium natans TaxID=878477 RepID=A0A812JJ66_9DINO|nr:IRGC [Symbiodinium natans]
MVAGHLANSGWLTLAGTALSGLGSTLSGLSTLYGLSAQMPQSLADLAVGGAAALGAKAHLGVLVSAKAFSLSTVSVGAGCVYASLGIVHFLRTLAQLSGARPPLHAPALENEADSSFPLPRWLSWRVLNWAVIGPCGSGKSTLINSLRGLKPRSPGAAPVGNTAKPSEPKAYMFQGDLARFTRMARLWDLPGAGTKQWPCATYVRDAGLRHFDGVLIVTSGPISEFEENLIKELKEFDVPCYLVRNKVDQDVMNNAQDNEMSTEETLRALRRELAPNSAPARAFLVSAKHPDCAKFDFQSLLRAMADDVAAQRAEAPELPDQLEGLPARDLLCLEGLGCDMGQAAEPAAPPSSAAPTRDPGAESPEPANTFLWAGRA